MSDSMIRFFTPQEVREHSFADDAFVSLNGKVLDLTPLVRQYKADYRIAALVNPIIRAAGTDISHWYDPETQDLKTCVDVVSGLLTYAQPHGRFAHVPTMFPDSQIDLTYDEPWWRDPQYVIGHLTRKTRRVRIINTLTSDEITLEMCAEETLQNMVDHRYIFVNAHAYSYTWKRHDPEPRILDMSKTLDENGIADETESFEALGLNADYYIPAIHLYYNDDLTEA